MAGGTKVQHALRSALPHFATSQALSGKERLAPISNSLFETYRKEKLEGNVELVERIIGEARRPQFPMELNIRRKNKSVFVLFLSSCLF